MKTKKLLLICTYIFWVALQLSCMNYYKISKAPQNRSTPDSIIRANPQRYFILRNGDRAYHMDNIVADKESLTSKLDTLSAEHELHLTNGRNGQMRFKKYKPEAVVLNEAHVYIQPDKTAIAGSDYTLNFGRIQKIEVLTKDKGRTTTSYVLGGLAIACLVMIPVVIIAASTITYSF